MSDLFFYLLPFILGGALSGIICGLLPFFLSFKRRRPWLGFFALSVCVACGVVLGAILAFPVAASFAAAILLTQERAPRPKRATTEPVRGAMPRPTQGVITSAFAPESFATEAFTTESREAETPV